jgi:hypothetical protein
MVKSLPRVFVIKFMVNDFWVTHTNTKVMPRLSLLALAYLYSNYLSGPCPPSFCSFSSCSLVFQVL